MKTLALIALAFLGQQEEFRQDITMRLDDLGDATIEVQFQLGAKGWLQWKQNIGDHPDLMRRNFIHQFPSQELSDFKLEKDEMNRRATASLKAKCGARYRGAGRFEAVLPASWKKVTDTGREWHFSFSEVGGQGVMLQQTHKIVLPLLASGARLSQPFDGQQILTYTVSRPGSSLLWALLTGVGAIGIAVGIGLRFAGQRRIESPGVKPTEV